ncbi:hypothetical protein RDI58_015607 [Solanum bulbocastanum]|uniref:Protein FAR1-RELATED SEQUENCE n=1 Tax=Solanum bulbocastanum TaxID=147425 RepID=A0AAN8TKU2_SOLBU
MEIGSSESQSECNLSIKLGMEFDWNEHAYDYYNEYNEYASAIGFSIRKEYANKNKAQGIMSVDKPQTFFTDQDPATSSAISLEMLDKYDLADNSWLKTTFAIREKWSMTYGRNTFSAGELCTCNVSTLGSVKEHVVTVKRSITQVSYSCKLFEYLGILCRHALKILDTLNIKDRILIQYILKRWTKNVTNINEMDVILEEKDIDPKVEVNARYRHLCHTFVQISTKASESKEGYELVVNGANEMIAKLKNIKKRKESPDKSAPTNTT